MSIIEQIKAEVERQAKSINTATGDFAEGRRMEQRIILSFLDTLQEKSEKPINPVCEDLEEEVKVWHKNHFKAKNAWEDYSGHYLDKSSQLDLARHFAQWQKDRDEAITDSVKFEEGFKTGREVGAREQKEQMMKEAVEGYYDKEYGHLLCPWDFRAKLMDGQKVFIIKED